MSEKIIPYLGYTWHGLVKLTAKLWSDGTTELSITDDDDMDYPLSSGLDYEYYLRYMNNLSILNHEGVML